MIQEERKEKRPAFQFYPKDFLTDGKVVMMTPEARGIYIMLLCQDWLEDGLPADPKLWLHLGGYNYCNRYGELRDMKDAEDVINSLTPCFVAHPKKKGLVTNPRLVRERIQMDNRANERALAGKRGAENRWKSDTKMAEPSVCHPETDSSVMTKGMAKNGSSSSSSSAVKDKPSPSARVAANDAPPALLFGQPAPPKAKPEIKNPSLSQAFHAVLKAHLREEPVGWSWGRAGKLFNSLLANFPEAEIRARFYNWFKSTKKGIVDRRWRVEDFVSNFNALKDGPILSWDDHKANETERNGSGIQDADATKKMLKEING